VRGAVRRVFDPASDVVHDLGQLLGIILILGRILGCQRQNVEKAVKAGILGQG